MITEDFVSYEAAKLLKEKGFEGRMHTFYTEEGIEMESAYVIPSNFFPIYRPTLQMAMKWLREVHNIALNVCYLLGMWSYSVYRTDVNSSGFNSEDFDTYEEACEDGIRYCLENLI